MNNLKYSAFSFIAVSILIVGMLFPLNKVKREINEVETRFSEIGTKFNKLLTFEDSLIYNQNFRASLLGSEFKREQLDSALKNNRLEVEQAINESETLNENRLQLGRKFRILNGIDKLLELLFAVTGGLTIYYWIKQKK